MYLKRSEIDYPLWLREQARLGRVYSRESLTDEDRREARLFGRSTTGVSAAGTDATTTTNATTAGSLVSLPTIPEATDPPNSSSAPALLPAGNTDDAAVVRARPPFVGSPGFCDANGIPTRHARQSIQDMASLRRSDRSPSSTLSRSHSPTQPRTVGEANRIFNLPALDTSSHARSSAMNNFSFRPEPLYSSMPFRPVNQPRRDPSGLDMLCQAMEMTGRSMTSRTQTPRSTRTPSPRYSPPSPTTRTADPSRRDGAMEPSVSAGPRDARASFSILTSVESRRPYIAPPGDAERPHSIHEHDAEGTPASLRHARIDSMAVDDKSWKQSNTDTQPDYRTGGYR
ncbi:hypothetical protein ANO11243_031840 [Dothideomycetidae sp. 11243]|nr:hypothetical protein ANO11243_031840 [fungal sp. No.11243]